MAPLLTIDVDASAVLRAFDVLGTAAERLLKGAASETAEKIANDARARVRVDTGQTKRGILIETSYDDRGFAVIATNPDEPGLPGWLEFGTNKMTASPFLFNAARLEEGAYLRRVAEALDDAIGEASQ